MSSTQSVVVAPVEDIILSGLQRQFQQVFRCTFVVVQSTDKKAMLQQFRTDKTRPQTYPFGFLTITALNQVEDTYNVKALVLDGTQVFKASDNKSYRATIMPVQLQLNVEYFTNSFRDMKEFANTWMFAPKLGYLHFNVNYGRTSFPIQVTPSTSLSIPTREAELDQAQEYPVTTEITVRSFMSRSTLLETEVVTNIETSLRETDPTTFADAGGDNAFWSFTRGSCS